MNKKLVGSAVVGAAVLAIVVVQFVGGGEEAPAAAPPPSPSMPTTTTLPSQGTLEAYNFPDVAGGRGWSIQIPVPTGWIVTHENDRASYRNGQVLLETDKVPITQEDALSGLKAVAAKAHQDGSVVKPVEAGDIQDAAKWDYTYVRDGYPERATVIGLGAGDSLVTIRYEAPPAEFDRNRGVLDAAMHVSAPG
ncbi:Uncharacterised protein [Amycolatopsis camponoti]|uniref:Uncharacterized protein n=1 Tax=Amycolatopsis camponoti TaxID=2606593 RepID=A0A6I8LFW5_9PSEU|nr:hypothetical protein [Amycolatopsis camponoti]VVJ15147.1 Uncharacterised protein [Amycolatopsis camponoti]